MAIFWDIEFASGTASGTEAWALGPPSNIAWRDGRLVHWIGQLGNRESRKWLEERPGSTGQGGG